MIIRHKKKIPSIRLTKLIESHKFFKKMYDRHIMTCYDTLRGFIIMHRNALSMLDTLKQSPTLQTTEFESIKLIEGELQTNIDVAQKQFDILEQDYPEAFKEAVNNKAKRLLLGQERQAVKELMAAGMLSDEDEEEMMDEIGKTN